MTVLRFDRRTIAKVISGVHHKRNAVPVRAFNVGDGSAVICGVGRAMVYRRRPWPAPGRLTSKPTGGPARCCLIISSTRAFPSGV